MFPTSCERSRSAIKIERAAVRASHGKEMAANRKVYRSLRSARGYGVLLSAFVKTRMQYLNYG